MTKKKLGIICLTIVLILGVCLLAGCGDKNGGGDALSEFVYLPEYVSLPKEVQDISQAFLSNDTLYFSSYMKTGTRAATAADPKPGEDGYYEGMLDEYGYGLYKINIDGTGLEKLANYTAPTVAEGKEGYAGLDKIAMDQEGNLWVLESARYSHMEGEGADQRYVEDSKELVLRKLDSTGAEQAKIDLTSLGEGKEYFYIQDMIIAADGYIYISDGDNAVYVLDGQGQRAFEMPLDNYSYGMVTTTDGKVAALSYGQTGQELRTIDSAAKKWGETIQLDNHNINSVYAGSGEYDLYYTDQNNFYGYNIKSKAAEKLVNWIDADLEGNPSLIVPLADGRILCLSNNYNSAEGTSRTDLILLTKTARADVPERKVITMACLYMDYNLRSEVVKFNKTNTEYRITIKDYSEFNTNEDYTAGLTKLNTEIISGNVPDILIVSQMPIKQYAAKGLIEDLTPYINNDTALGGMDAFLTNVFDACKVGEMLPFISSTFSIQSAVGASRIVGTEPGWTIDEMNAALAKMPAGATVFNPQSLDKNSLLQALCMINIDEYVDWAAGKSHFDNPEFIKFLEFAKTGPEPIDNEKVDWETFEWDNEADLVREGKIMLTFAYISDFSDMNYNKLSFKEPITYIGFPSGKGVGSVFSIDNGLALSSKSEHKDAAWQFIRTVLTEEYQTERSWWGLPTNKAAFDKKAASALDPDSASGGAVSVSRAINSGGGEEEMPKLTQADIDQLIDLISKIDATTSYDQAIMNIITEESAAFFAGKKSAEDTAKVIQSRVGTYVSEQS